MVYNLIGGWMQLTEKVTSTSQLKNILVHRTEREEVL